MRWGVWVLSCLVVVSLLIWGTEAYVNRKWDGRQRFTVVDLGNPIVISSLDPVTSEGIKVTLPGNLMIETVGGRGKWKAEAMPKAAQKFGLTWARDSVCDYLGIPCTTLSSGLTLWDKYLWWKWNRNVQWKSVDLAGSEWVVEGKAPDGADETQLSPTWADKAYEWFASSVVIGENLHAEIANTTDVTGLGSHAARSLETLGIKVGMISSESPEIEKCKIEANQGTLQTRGVGWMVKTLGCDVSTKSTENGELKLYLGKSYAQWLLGDYSSGSGISVN